MKKVIIKCISNCNLVVKYHIIIFDKYKHKVYDEYIKTGRAKLCLHKGVYKVMIIPIDISFPILSTSFIVTEEINCFNFCLGRDDNSLKITAILVDKNYNNLPIERGEIKLWQDHIQ